MFSNPVNRYTYERMLSALFIVLLVEVIASSACWQLLKFLFQGSDSEWKVVVNVFIRHLDTKLVLCQFFF